MTLAKAAAQRLHRERQYERDGIHCAECSGTGWTSVGAACTIADHRGDPLPHMTPCPACGGIVTAQ